jgi:hypothetical protein
MGTYGFLLRQYLDVSKDRLKPTEWQVRIEGIEIFEGYRNPVWDYVYDKVMIGDIRILAKDLESYDVVICNDVLEHLQRTEARLVIDQILCRSPVLITTTPNREFPQEIRAGNEAERHLCLLDSSDFPKLVAKMITGVTSLYLCCSDKSMYPILQEAVKTCSSHKSGQLSYQIWRAKRKIKKMLEF